MVGAKRSHKKKGDSHKRKSVTHQAPAEAKLVPVPEGGVLAEAKVEGGVGTEPAMGGAAGGDLKLPAGRPKRAASSNIKFRETETPERELRAHGATKSPLCCLALNRGALFPLYTASPLPRA